MFLDATEARGADRFRERAGKCRQLASNTNDPRIIESLRKLAEEYDGAEKAVKRGLKRNG
jgi:hypothetical protein